MKKFLIEMIKKMNKCKKIIQIYFNLKYLEKIFRARIKKLREISLNLTLIEKIMKILINLILSH